ncbi:MAG: secretion system protein E [Gammaproteobacteria bacterium]|nr:MAG: secretion system protein E [Gammaproteobacteria bacterium]RLA15753.1 MAG: secretion system protein E [Gammaproteobacteria bacterium]
MNKPLPIGLQLQQKGLVTEDQIQIALLEQKKSGDPIARILVNMGFISEAIARDALSESFGQDSVDLSKLLPDADALVLVPQELARRHSLLPVDLNAANSELTVAMADTQDMLALDQLRAKVGSQITVKPVLASEGDLAANIDDFYGYSVSIDAILKEIETGVTDFSALEAIGLDTYQQPVVRLVNALLTEAVKQGASDIHFEPEAHFARVRYRIDGVLRQIRSLHKDYWPAMVVRLKIISGMNIAENRAPQDGRISLRLRGRQIDFRVSAQPTVHGENIVLRILDRSQAIVPLDHLGLSDTALTQLQLMIARPEGIILVTGPTGSGKTTTLYSVLNHINSERINIMTLEDPVEYPMALIRQSSVTEGKLDFAEGIRSMMRQDPDVILIGEIRDRATAEMAFRASMTGHQVLSTLHTNSALGALPRLADIGVSNQVIAGNIIGISAQRLIRKLCPECREAYHPGELEQKLLGMANDDVTLYRAVGCEACHMQGYKGRFSVTEVVRFDDDIDELILENAPLTAIRNIAREKGFQSLADDGTERILSGQTSIDEITRVIDLTQRL